MPTLNKAGEATRPCFRLAFRSYSPQNITRQASTRHAPTHRDACAAARSPPPHASPDRQRSQKIA
eukprot:6205637-Pleurochrysis_carterae.AAC.1